MKNNNATTWLLAVYDSDLTSTQKIICAYLRSHMNDYRDVAWPSIDRIAAKCSLGRRTVLDNLPKICEMGFLLRNGTSDMGTIRYAICSPEEGGAAVARVRETTKRGAVAAPEVNKEVNNSIRGWADWVQYRKEIRKKMTPATIKKQVALLEQHSPEDQLLIINQSITNGWTGLFPLKEKARKGANSTRAANIYDELSDTSWAS